MIQFWEQGLNDIQTHLVCAESQQLKEIICFTFSHVTNKLFPSSTEVNNVQLIVLKDLPSLQSVTAF